MATFEEFVQTELPTRPFAPTDGAAGQVLARSSRPERPRELVWVDVPSANPGLPAPAGVGGVGGHRAVMLAPDGTVVHADPANADSYIGISKSAAAGGDQVAIATRDTISEPTWAWQPGMPLFFLTNGTLTQAPPTSTCVPHVGVAITPTTVLLSKLHPIFIGA